MQLCTGSYELGSKVKVQRSITWDDRDGLERSQHTERPQGRDVAQVHELCYISAAKPTQAHTHRDTQKGGAMSTRRTSMERWEGRES